VGRLRFVLFLLLGLIGAIVWFRLAPTARAFGLFEKAGSQQLLRIIVGYLATVAGVVLGSTYRQLRQLRDSGIAEIQSLRAFAARAFRSVDLWMGLCGSPLVFLLLIKASDGLNLPGLVVSALENGFCCLIIINGFVGKAEAQQKAPATP